MRALWSILGIAQMMVVVVVVVGFHPTCCIAALSNFPTLSNLPTLSNFPTPFCYVSPPQPMCYRVIKLAP